MEFMEIHLFNSIALGLEFGMEFQTGIQSPIPVLESSKHTLLESSDGIQSGIQSGIQAGIPVTKPRWIPVLELGMDSSLDSSLDSITGFQ